MNLYKYAIFKFALHKTNTTGNNLDNLNVKFRMRDMKQIFNELDFPNILNLRTPLTKISFFQLLKYLCRRY